MTLRPSTFQHSFRLLLGCIASLVLLTSCDDGVSESANGGESSPTSSEPLRERQQALDATLTVTNLNDSGAGSFREAMAAAEPGDTIVFDPALFASGTQQVITFSSPVQTLGAFFPGFITRNVVVRGPGPRLLAFDGGGTTSLIVPPGSGAFFSHYTFEGIEFRNGRGTDGAAISAGGQLTIRNCVFRDNSATDSGVGNQGGAVASGDAALLTIVDSSFINNQGQRNGGALMVRGPMELDGCTFSGNSAAGQGGAIYILNSGPWRIRGTTIVGNSAGTSGGGVAATTPGEFLIENSIVASNTAPVLPNVLGNLSGTIRFSLIGDARSLFTGAVSDSVFGESAFVDAPVRALSGQFSMAPQACSAAWDGADPAWTDDADIAGRSRPTFNGPDMGSAELQSALPPCNLQVPTISGSALVAATLTASTGTWRSPFDEQLSWTWQRCDAAGLNCSTIATAANAATLVLTLADVGSTIRLRVVASILGGSLTTAVQSAPTAVVVGSGPVNTVLPVVTGLAEFQQTLTTTQGTWTGTAPIAFGIQWQRCIGASCTDIPGATGTTYTVTLDDVTRSLRTVVTATNPVTSATATSVATAVVPTAPPILVQAPVISGLPIVGQTLTATDAIFTGGPGLTFSRRWRRCTNVATPVCSNISPTQSGLTYTLTAADIGFLIQYRSTASVFPGGVLPADSNRLGPVLGEAPSFTSVGAIAGTPNVEGTLTAVPPTAQGIPAPVVTWQWQRCLGAVCNAVAGADNALTLALTTADFGFEFQLFVTATNLLGTVTQTSPRTVPIAGVAPRLVDDPLLGTATTVGQTQTVTEGVWDGFPVPTIGFQWLICLPGALSCTPIDGETGPSLVLDESFIGRQLAVDVTATNSAGSTTVRITAQIPVFGIAPTQVASPSISGSVEQGQTLTFDPGEWSGVPTPDVTWVWQRCEGEVCTDLAIGTTTRTYVTTPSDIDFLICGVVTASNGELPNATAAVGCVGPIQGAPPRNVARPTISGVVAVGEVLTANPGTWTGSPLVQLPISWERCIGAVCTAIPAAAGDRYRVTSEDVGRTLRARVDATNDYGNDTAFSEPTTQVGAVAPTVATLGTANGFLSPCDPLGYVAPAFGGAPSPDVTYAWLRCTAADLTTCTEIPGADTESYSVVSDDLERFIYLEVTATNSAGSVTTEVGPWFISPPRAPVCFIARVEEAASGTVRVQGSIDRGGSCDVQTSLINGAGLTIPFTPDGDGSFTVFMAAADGANAAQCVIDGGLAGRDEAAFSFVIDQCSDLGACDQVSGVCSAASGDGTSCDDGLLCTSNDVCGAGRCSGTAVACVSGDSCTVSACDPGSGACVATALPDGSSCADADPCDGDETCVSGACTAAAEPLDCPAPTNPCEVAVCFVGEGCGTTPVEDGVRCSTDSICGGLCEAGTCEGGVAIDCDDDDVCTTDRCDDATFECINEPIAACGEDAGTDASDVSDVADVGDATDVSDVTDVGDATDVSDVSDAADAADVSDVSDATDISDAADVADTSDAADVADVDADSGADGDASAPDVAAPDTDSGQSDIGTPDTTGPDVAAPDVETGTDATTPEVDVPTVEDEDPPVYATGSGGIGCQAADHAAAQPWWLGLAVGALVALRRRTGPVRKIQRSHRSA